MSIKFLFYLLDNDSDLSRDNFFTLVILITGIACAVIALIILLIYSRRWNWLMILKSTWHKFPENKHLHIPGVGCRSLFSKKLYKPWGTGDTILFTTSISLLIMFVICIYLEDRPHLYS